MTTAKTAITVGHKLDCRLSGLWGFMFTLGLACIFVGGLAGCKPRPTGPDVKATDRGEVVVYCSVDEVYARPVLEQFTRKTGIQVKLVADSEETKSTGLLHRLLAEKERPQADVFWSGDPVRTAILKLEGASTPFLSRSAEGLSDKYNDPEHHYTCFSSRVRVLIYNRKLLPESSRPRSVLDLTNVAYAGKACLANPLFGTTSMHAAAWFQVWGEEKAKRFFEAMTANGVAMLSSNGEVRRRVAQGDYAFGLTDSDDANVAMKEGQPVGMVLPDQDGLGALMVPNAVALIARAPNSVNGQSFVDFVLSPAVEQSLADSEAAQIPLRAGLKAPAMLGLAFGQIRAMTVNYHGMAQQLQRLSQGYLQDWVATQGRGPQPAPHP